MDEHTTPQTTTDENAENKPKLRGFARLSPEQRSAVASLGGKTAHARGTANRFDSKTASIAGRIAHERGTAYRWNREEASEAGKKGRGVRRRRHSQPSSPS